MRSGSTLLGMLLGTHPSIQYMGELRNYQSYSLDEGLCFCGSPMSQCVFWSQISALLPVEVSSFQTKSEKFLIHQLIKYLSLLNFAVKLIETIGRKNRLINMEYEIIRNIIALYDIGATVSKKAFICDSSHRNTQAKLLYLYYPHRFKMIHLVRDGRGVVNSIMRRKGFDIREASLVWRRHSRFTFISQCGIPSHKIMRIRYEDLCRDTGRVLAEVSRFLGLEIPQRTPKLVEYEFHFIGGSDTLRGKRVLEITLDERWRSDLSAQELRVFDRIAGGMNRIFGYHK